MPGKFCIGLTGGIGCGKSSAARLFAERGAAVVDTDEISHEFTRAGGAAMGAIRRAFPGQYITPEGALDRARMRSLVFRDPAARERLEAILHPLIRAEVQARIAGAQAPYVVLVVPLLLETGAYRDVAQRILVVDCDEAEQIARTMQRSGLERSEVEAIIAAQAPRATRLGAADDVLPNTGTVEELRREVEKLHARYLALAAEHARRVSGSSRGV